MSDSLEILTRDGGRMSNLTGRGPHQKTSDEAKKLDAEFLAWLREQTCAACWAPPPSDPAHVTINGRAAKAKKPLFSAISLCRACHSTQHTHGYTTLADKDTWLFWSGESLRNWLLSR